jgi:type I restriction enzyme, S subunit
MKYKQLSQTATWRTDRISTKKVNNSNYISTENMLPNRGGIENASSLPNSKILSKYVDGDILLSNIRPYFKKIWFANTTGGCSNDVLVVRPNGIDAKFLYYVLSDNNFFNYSTITAKGTKMPRGSKTAIMKYLVPDVDAPTQSRIAQILSAYDDAIENNTRRIALLEKASRELYREWFVRFRFPGYEGARVVNGLPEGWEVIRLGDIVNITSSKRIYMSDYVADGIPFYRSKEVIQSANGEALTEPLFISASAYNKLKDRFGAPCENDILITSVGTIGVSFLVDKREFYFKDGNLTWLQSGTTPDLALYIFLWLNSDIGQSSLLSSTIGTSQSALTIEKLKRIKLVKPDNSVILAFYGKAMAFVELKRKLQTQSQNLARQRDLLLPRLMTGNLEV